jgi:hypothetical protein
MHQFLEHGIKDDIFSWWRMQLFADFVYDPRPVFSALFETVVEIYEIWNKGLGIDLALTENSNFQFFFGQFLSIPTQF